MGLEIERRFLVLGEGWRSLAGPPQPFRQGYLVSGELGFTVRVRIQAREQAWLTLKAPAEGIARHEFEYPIPLLDAESLWELAADRLVKTRFCLERGGGDWVVDCFEQANAPLVLAEVELPCSDAPLQLPEWCGEEVTGRPQFSNALLASTPMTAWSEVERRIYGLT